MRLKSIGISNFKAFGKEFQTIPIKPITLVFGPNSAGKSSLLHSLLWLNHVSQTGDCNVTAPLASMGQINLEGFLQIRHRHQPGNVNFSLSYACDPPSSKPENGGKPSCISLEINLNYGEMRQPNTESAFGLTGCSLILDGKIFLKNSMSRVTELDLTHPVFGEALAKLAKDTKATEKSILAFLSKIIKKGAFDIRATNGLPVGLDYDFMEFILICSERPRVSFERTGEFITEILPSVSKVFKLVTETVGASVGKLTYLPPVRELPPRNFDPSMRKENAWKEIARNPDLVKQLNQWLSDKDKFATGYRLENRAFLPTNSIQKASPGPLRRELWNLLTNTNFAADAAVLMEDAEAEFQKMDGHEYIRNYPEFYQSRIEDTISCLGDDNVDSLPENERFQWGKSIIDDMISNKDDWLWDHFLAHFQPLVEFLDEKWSIEAATQRLSASIERECKDRKYEFSLVQNGSETRLALQDVGFGISQFLPVLIHSFASKNQLIAIEQPELHLHPRLQADFGDAFIESALGENHNTFLLETHSEHLILRILRRIRETSEGGMAEWPEALRKACPNGIRPEDVAVLYVQPGKEGAEVMELPVDANGEFTCDWPGGFFEERMNELF